MRLDALATVTLGIRTGKENLEPSGGEAYRVVQTRHLQNGSMAPSKELKQVYLGEGQEPARFAVKKGDILVAMLGADPKVVLVDGSPRRILADKDLATVRPASPVNGKKVFDFLASKDGQALLRSLRSGVTIPHMKLGDLKAVEVP